MKKNLLIILSVILILFFLYTDGVSIFIFITGLPTTYTHINIISIIFIKYLINFLIFYFGLALCKIKVPLKKLLIENVIITILVRVICYISNLLADFVTRIFYDNLVGISFLKNIEHTTEITLIISTHLLLKFLFVTILIFLLLYSYLKKYYDLKNKNIIIISVILGIVSTLLPIIIRIIN